MASCVEPCRLYNLLFYVSERRLPSHSEVKMKTNPFSFPGCVTLAEVRRIRALLIPLVAALKRLHMKVKTMFAKLAALTPRGFLQKHRTSMGSAVYRRCLCILCRSYMPKQLNDVLTVNRSAHRQEDGAFIT